MKSYIIRRLAQTIPVLLIITILVFLLIYLTGDPLSALVRMGENLSEEQMTILRAETGLDKPIVVQWATWLGNVLQGDLGNSIIYGYPVSTELKNRLPITFQLGILALLFALVISVPLGIVSATRRGSRLDYGTTAVAVSAAAIPQFWLGMMVVLLFSVSLGWLCCY